MTSQEIHGSCVQLKPCSAIIILPACSEVLHDAALIWQQLNRVSCCKGLLFPYCFSALSGDTEVFCYASQISLRTQPRVEETIVLPFSSKPLPRLQVYMTLQLCFHTSCELRSQASVCAVKRRLFGFILVGC